jgi:hypothetical protein
MYVTIRAYQGNTQEGADASTAAAAAWLSENLPDMAASPYVTAGETVVSF